MEWIQIPSQLLQWIYFSLSQVGEGKVCIPESLEDVGSVTSSKVDGALCAMEFRQVSLYEDAMYPFESIFPSLDVQKHLILLRELWFRPEFLPQGFDDGCVVVHQSHCDNSISTLFLELDTDQSCQLEVRFGQSWRHVHFCEGQGALRGLMLPGIQHPLLDGVVHRVIAQNSKDFHRHSLVIQLRQQVKK